MNNKIPGQRPCLGRGGRRMARKAIGVMIAALVVGSTPVAWAQAPRVSSVTPVNGATDVATGADIVFVFDQPMDTNVPLLTGFPGIFVGNFEVTGAGGFVSFQGAWSADGRTLTCSPSSAYPGNATIAWTLNPAGSMLPFTNEDGTETLATVSGSFTVGAGGGGDEDCNGLPDGWGGYSLFKGAFYNQDSAADPVPETPEGFLFGANVTSPAGGPPVTEASLRLPDNSTRDLEQLFGFFIYSAAADLESELEAAYPPGSYAVRFTQTGEPARSINMTMPANNVPVPKLLNYAEAQAIDAAQDFTVRWNAFTGATADDYLSISVSEEQGQVVFEAPDLCLPRELAVTATSVVIPAGTLVDGRTYSATLTFGKVFYASTNAVPGMSGFGSLSRMTTFSMRAGTGGGPADPATLSDFRLLANGNPEFQLSGTPARVYTIERTDGLTPGSVWTGVGAVTLDGAGQGLFEDTQVGKVFPLFYRAVTE